MQTSLDSQLLILRLNKAYTGWSPMHWMNFVFFFLVTARAFPSRLKTTFFEGGSVREEEIGFGFVW